MAVFHEHPGEVEPTDEELRGYRGLRNLRYRRDGEVVVGLFLTVESNETVITVARRGGVPYRLPVTQEIANAAYEQPFTHLDRVGQEIYAELLNGGHKTAAGL